MPNRFDRIINWVGQCLALLLSAHHRRQQPLVGLQVAGDAAPIFQVLEGIKHAQAGAQSLGVAYGAGGLGNPAVFPAHHYPSLAAQAVLQGL